MKTDISAVVFDLGGVLIDWNPRYLYRRLMTDENDMEAFLGSVCTPEWNATMDAGRPFVDAVAQLIREHPDRAGLIEAYRTNWTEMLGDAFEDTLALMRHLRAGGVPVYALSNWSSETFATTRARFPFLEEFDGILISGEVGVAKPDVAIFAEFLKRFGLIAERTVFLDDSAANVAAARTLGIRSILFTGASRARTELEALGLPV